MISVRLALFSLLLALSSWSHAMVFAINEGVTYRVNSEEIRTRYAAIAADLGRLLGQPVRIEPVGDYGALGRGLASGAYDIALVHPAHVSIVAIKRHGWRLLAVTKGYEDYRASFLVRAASPYKTLEDLRGLKVGAPEEDSITAWMVRAALREALGDLRAVTLNYTRYQDAVPFMVENTFTEAGATAAPALIRKWEAQGGRIIARSRAVPIKHLIANPQLTADQVARLRDYFITLDSTEAGRRKLEPVKVQGYTAYDQATLLQLGTWLGL